MIDQLKNKKLLLHVCCAPCSGGIIEYLRSAGAVFTLFFYNPNIYPLEEYLRRKNEIMSFADKFGITSIDVDNDPDKWFERVKGLEDEPERGLRCQACFDMRLERAALYAHEHGFDYLTTTNGISRWKDMKQVRAAGTKAVSRYPSLVFLDKDWRKDGGMERMSAVTKRERFYRQDYCGCLYSFEASKKRKNNKTL
jgi:predicted adenine nucleotide alpha hydrolase (AANH) superfamily ATPase